MKTKDNPLRQKRHADWQNPYRRSSNFSKLVEDDTEKMTIKGNGKLKMKAPDEDIKDTKGS